MKIISMFILILVPLSSFSHDNEHSCIFIHCRDCSYEDQFIGHYHYKSSIFPTLLELDSITNIYRGMIVFDSINKISDEQINIILSSNSTSISLKNVKAWTLDQLKLIVKQNYNNEYISKIDERNDSTKNMIFEDSLVLFKEIRLFEQAYFPMYSLIITLDTLITDEQAVVLSSYRGTYLQINNVTFLTDYQAKILSRFKGYAVCMPDLNDTSKTIYDNYRTKYFHYKSNRIKD